jgi:hypothetical protein
LDIDSAIEAKSASFDLWAIVFYLAQRSVNSDESDRARYVAVLPQVFQAFEHSHGRVVKQYICTNFKSAVALSIRRWRKAELNMVFNILETALDDEESQELAATLYTCRDMTLKVNEYLSGKALRVCLDQIYWVTSEIYARLDEKLVDTHRGALARKYPYMSWAFDWVEEGVSDSEQYQSLIVLWKEQLSAAEAFFQRAVNRSAIMNYLFGMLCGLLIIAGIGASGWGLLHHTQTSVVNLGYGLAAFLSGSVGAVVSVMMRIASDKLLPNYETGRIYLRFQGAVRPALGSLFGVLTYFAITSTLLHVAPPNSGATQLAFYIALSFAAGFNERFAQDILKQVEVKAAPPVSAESG